MLSYLPTYRSFPSARSSAPTPRPFGQVYLVCLYSIWIRIGAIVAALSWLPGGL